MSILQTRPALRWLAPLTLVGVVAGTGLIATTANADPTLPPRTAKELLVDLQSAHVDAVSGTVVQRSDLGIPEIPGVGGSNGSELNSLISGSHTLKVWYAAPDKARLQLLGRLGESDVIANGTDLWTWSSQQNAATHRTLDRSATKTPDTLPSDAPTTPGAAADRVLAAIDPSTEVNTSSNSRVADRDAYELVLKPKDTESLISSVQIAVDGEKKIPLRVEVFAGDRSVFSVGYSSIDFARPDDAQFAFNPPPGVKVTEIPAEKPGDDRSDAKPSDEPQIVGTGWTTVVIQQLPPTESGENSEQLDRILQALPKVSGSWGSGRLLAGTAFSVVVTDDGRVAIGAVRPERLYDALTK